MAKFMKTGGILDTLKVNAVAQATGTSVMMGSVDESSLGPAALFHLSVTLAHATHRGADLRWRLDGHPRDIGSGRRAELRDRVSTVLVPLAPGLGITPDKDAIASPRATRCW